MAVFRKLRRAGKVGAPAKKQTKKQNLVSKQKSSMKKTMGPSQQDRDRSEVPALATTPRVGFMDLSGELRNRIYRGVLHFEGAIMIGQKGQNDDRLSG
jgi:hypothetical protein